MNPPEDASANDSLALFTTESDIYAFGMTVLEVNTFLRDLWTLGFLPVPTDTDLYGRNSISPEEK
jgi:hypothetical protein